MEEIDKIYSSAVKGNSESKKTLSDWIKSEREKRNWSKKEFASKLDINPSNIGSYEGGSKKTVPSKKTFKNIKSVFKDDPNIIKPFNEWASEIISFGALNYGVQVSFKKIDDSLIS